MHIQESNPDFVYRVLNSILHGIVSVPSTEVIHRLREYNLELPFQSSLNFSIIVLYFTRWPISFLHTLNGCNTLVLSSILAQYLPNFWAIPDLDFLTRPVHFPNFPDFEVFFNGNDTYLDDVQSNNKAICLSERVIAQVCIGQKTHYALLLELDEQSFQFQEILSNSSVEKYCGLSYFMKMKLHFRRLYRSQISQNSIGQFPI